MSDLAYRRAYAESLLDSTLACQIKQNRERCRLTQAQLARRVGTKQPGIARLENVNYSGWKIATLKKLARAFGMRLRITFEPLDTARADVRKLFRSPAAQDGGKDE